MCAEVWDVDSLKARLDALRPLTPAQISAVRRSFRGEDIEFVYASNAIEGSRLTLRETQVVVEQGVTIGGKPLQDHIDARNGARAVAFMLEIVESERLLDASAILELHTLVLGADDARAGRIRTYGVKIVGARHVPPAWPDVSEAFDAMLVSYRERRDRTHPVILAADLHHAIARLHPFGEGTGRTARLVANAHLMQFGYAPVVVDPAERLAYYEVLALADDGDVDAFRTFVAERERRALDRYLAVIGAE